MSEPNLILFFRDEERQEPIAFLLAHIMVTPEDRALGLSGHTSMEKNHGMGFLFDEAKPVRMQVRQTKIPLDIIFVDETGHIVHIEEKTATMSDMIYGPEIPVIFVIEANAGWAAEHAIDVGTIVGVA
jgi:uncharacterized membrane protein (UPF0127 family)